MSAKSILTEAQEAKKELVLLKRRKDQYMDMATSISGTSENFIRSTDVHSRVENAALRLVEVCDRLEREAERYAEAISKAEALISSLDNSKYRQVLTLRYIEGCNWKKICEEMGYRDEKSAFRVHGWALQAADSKLHSAM